MSFEDKLRQGQIGESLIAQWLKRRGLHVLPVYEVETNTGKGPRLFSPSQQLIAPDMLAFTDGKTMWIEAKHKTAFSWHRLTKRWVTGIDMRHYEDYCKVADTTPFPVWLLFLQRGGHAKDSPDTSPSGLYGNSLAFLREHENHRFGNYGAGGMVYWAIDVLKLLSSLEIILDTRHPLKETTLFDEVSITVNSHQANDWTEQQWQQAKQLSIFS